MDPNGWTKQGPSYKMCILTQDSRMKQMEEVLWV